jgi:spermidine synthase
MRALRWALVATGAAGLILEITWLRLFGHVLGATYAVAGCVLGFYLGGLGLGAILFGRDKPSPSAALRLLARLEAGAALAALPVPWILHGLRAGLPWELATRLWVQVPLVAALVLPASILAGGSLPMAVAATGTPERATRLYAANTWGGVIGAVAAVLLPGAVGVHPTYALALGLQLAVAAVALHLARRARMLSHPAAPPHPQGALPAAVATRETTPAVVRAGAVGMAAAASGFVLLGSEMLWVRLLSTRLHNSALTFGLVLAVVVGALYAGARLASGSARFGSAALATVWTAGLVALFGSGWLFATSTGGAMGLERGNVAQYLADAVWLVALVVALPCVLLGASLPLLWAHTGSRGLTRHVARTLAINTMASVAGSVLAGALLLPSLGTQGTLRVLLVAAALGVAAAHVVAGATRRRLVVMAGAGAALALLGPLPAPERLGSPVPRNHTVVETVRGANGELTVTRHERTGTLHLRHNAIYRLGSTSTPTVNRRMGQLPLVRHGDAQRVAFLGLGTGITASAVLDHPEVKEVLVFELMAEVVALTHHFGDVNGHVMHDPRVRVVVGDGRRALAAEGPPLDLVVSDLFIPWHPGSSDLYALELFTQVRQRLAPGGIFALWIPAYQLGEQEMDSVMAAFREAFPASEAVQLDAGAARPVLGLWGHAAPEPPPPIPAPRLAALMARSRFAPDLSLEARRVSELMLGPLPILTTRPNTESRPVVELQAPLSHIARRELAGPRYARFVDRRFPQSLLTARAHPGARAHRGTRAP